jgi:hypothetical protein
MQTSIIKYYNNSNKNNNSNNSNNINRYLQTSIIEPYNYNYNYNSNVSLNWHNILNIGNNNGYLQTSIIEPYNISNTNNRHLQTSIIEPYMYNILRSYDYISKTGDDPLVHLFPYPIELYDDFTYYLHIK